VGHRLGCLAFAFVLTLVSIPIHFAQARVFNFQKQSFSTYLRGTYGFTMLQKDAYQGGFPNTVSFPNQAGVSQAYSAEVGFGLSSKYLTWRLGVELLNPAQTKDAAGLNASGTQWLTLSSEAYSVIPQVNVEFVVRQGPTWRWYFGGGIGYAITTFKNTVTMTAAGTTALGGVTDYIEEGSNYGLMGQGMSGFEFAFFDNVSMSFDLGYRYLNATGFKSNRDSRTACNQFYSGNTVTDCAGGDRALNLSGLFTAANFRIYIQ
jgi:hypothetical protein